MHHHITPTMRFDIAFFLCCCRSFLSSNGRDDTDEEYYHLLGVERNATGDELKRAYKRQSLLMHPDKLAQKGQPVTSADRDRFTRMRSDITFIFCICLIDGIYSHLRMFLLFCALLDMRMRCYRIPVDGRRMTPLEKGE